MDELSVWRHHLKLWIYKIPAERYERDATSISKVSVFHRDGCWERRGTGFAQKKKTHRLCLRVKECVRRHGAGVFENRGTSFATSKLNDNTTQMSVPIVGNKSLSSYDCAAKLGPSDSLITSLSWVCLCCLNCCLLGPNIPPLPPLPGKQKATTALRRLWIRLSMSPHLHRPTERANPAGRPSPRPVPSTPQCSGPVSRRLIPHSDPLRRTSSALRRVKQSKGDQ